MALTDKQAAFVREYLIDFNATQAAIRAGYDLRECDGSEEGCYVYLLTDPSTGEIFYVGKGTGRRYRRHETEWRTGAGANGAKLLRFDEAVENSGRVATLRFADGLNDDEAFRIERVVINEIGIDRLTNATPGQETRADHAAYLLSRVKPFDQWVSERCPPEHEVDLYEKVVATLRELADGRGPPETWTMTAVIEGQ